MDTNTPYAQVITESKENGTKIGYTYGNDLLHNGTHFYLTDALGSTRGLVDSGERLTDSYSYTPYGELSEHNGTSENSFLFTGEQLDSETDDYYLRARYYSPSSIRFLSRDSYDGTLIEPITLNHYAYAHSNPTIFIDPSGNMVATQQELSFNIAVIGQLSHTNIRATVKVTSSVLSQLRDSKKYIINPRHGETHSTIYATDIQTSGGYIYDLEYDTYDEADISWDVWEKRIAVDGWIRKRTIDSSRNPFYTSPVKLSSFQFEVWDYMIFEKYPIYRDMFPDRVTSNPDYLLDTTRHHPYLADKINCVSYVNEAYKKAWWVMLHIPSI